MLITLAWIVTHRWNLVVLKRAACQSACMWSDCNSVYLAANNSCTVHFKMPFASYDTVLLCSTTNVVPLQITAVLGSTVTVSTVSVLSLLPQPTGLSGTAWKNRGTWEHPLSSRLGRGANIFLQYFTATVFSTAYHHLLSQHVCYQIIRFSLRGYTHRHSLIFGLHTKGYCILHTVLPRKF